ncbi:hypothetical protein V8E36_004604 [Tilletia maclaganii]
MPGIEAESSSSGDGALRAAGPSTEQQRFFSLHLPKAWSFFTASKSDGQSSSAYSRLPQRDSAGNNHGGERDADDEGAAVERPSRPSLTSMTSSNMSETSIALEEDNEADKNLGALERTHAWSRYNAFERLGIVFAFILLGAGVLLSFNALISPTEYFRSRLRHTPYENTFSSWIVSVYNVVSIIFGAHAVATLGRDTRASLAKGAAEVEAGLAGSSSNNSGGAKQLQIMRRAVRRTFWSGFVVVACLVVLALSTTFRYTAPVKPLDAVVEVPANTYFYTILVISFILAAAVSYLQNAVVAVCSTFGPKAMSLMLTGQGVIGLSISLVQLAAAWAQSDPAVQAKVEAALLSNDDTFVDPATAAARIFFSTGAALMTLTLIGFSLLIRSECWTEVLEASTAGHSRRSSAATAVFRRTSIAGDGSAPGGGHSRRESVQDPLVVHSSVEVGKVTEKSAFLRWISAHVSPETLSSIARLWDVQAQTIVLCLTIAYIFVLTLALFPALTARVQSVGFTDHHGSSAPQRWQTPLVFAAIHFVAFNFTDLLGRSLPGIIPSVFLIRSTALLVILTASRTILFPLLRGTNLPRRDGSKAHSSNSILRTDTAFFLIMLVMGLSNGVLATSILIAGPAKVRAFGHRSSSTSTSSTAAKAATRSAQALSATVLSYWLTLGLAVGSALSFVSVQWA